MTSRTFQASLQVATMTLAGPVLVWVTLPPGHVVGSFTSVGGCYVTSCPGGHGDMNPGQHTEWWPQA